MIDQGYITRSNGAMRTQILFREGTGHLQRQALQSRRQATGCDGTACKAVTLGRSGGRERQASNARPEDHIGRCRQQHRLVWTAAQPFFAQFIHHPVEATFLPGNSVQGPVASPALP